MTHLVTIPQSMETLHVSRTKIYHLIDTRELVRVNIGSRAFITGESINAFLDRIVAAAS